MAASPASPTGPARTTPLTPYQRRLFFFLSVATFFEGYDFIALTQILPNLQAEMHLSDRGVGALVGIINAGTIIAYLLVRKADRWGRKSVLTVTIAGYTLFTFLSGLAPNVYAFALLQMAARVFLIGEWAVSHVIAAEEFPAERRGMVLGVVSGFASLGSILCVGVVPLLLKTSFGWRSVYFVGIIPLLFLAYARRGLKETRRFEEQVDREKSNPLTHIFRTPYRRRVLELGAMWFLAYLCTQNGITFWKKFALAERALSDATVAKAIAIAAVASMPLVFFTGKMLDVIGRRVGAVVILGATSAGVFGAYTFTSFPGLVLALVAGIYGSAAVLPLFNAYTTELFPTELRGDAFAWSNNLIGRVGYVLSPFAIGFLAEKVGWGAAVRPTALFPLLSLVLLWLLLPETKQKELEETSKL